MGSIEQNADRLAALGHPIRLGILRQVVQGPAAGTPAGEVQQALGIPASTLSHHLGTLSAAGLVQVERQGTTLRYRVDFGTLRDLTAFLWEDCCRRDPDREADGEASCCAPAFPGTCVPADPPAAARPAPPAARPWSPDVD